MEETVILNTKCPVCGKPATLEYKPFCSKRCADIDLGRWLKGSYVVHTEETLEENESVPTLSDSE